MTTRIEAELVGGPRDGDRILVNANEQGVPRPRAIEVLDPIHNPARSEETPWEPSYLGYQRLRYVCGDDVLVSADGLVWYYTLESP